jgi:Flp pilus assembly protein CpaB
MSFSLRSTIAASDASDAPDEHDRPAQPTPGSLSPAASRRRPNRLRDPRVWAGGLLLALSALGGARALAHADDTTAVWVAAHDLRAGQPLSTADVTVAHVHFDSTSERALYLSADGPPPTGLSLATSVTAGELVAESALSSHEQVAPQLPLGVGEPDVPADLRAGQHVAVWAVADQQHDSGRDIASLVLADVVVLDVSGSNAGISGSRQVLVEVQSDDDVRVALTALAGARPVLVRVGT